jgi:hypothetical protein
MRLVPSAINAFITAEVIRIKQDNQIYDHHSMLQNFIERDLADIDSMNIPKKKNKIRFDPFCARRLISHFETLNL